MISARKLVVAVATAGVVVALGAAPAAAGSGNTKKFCKTYLSINKVINAEEPDTAKLNKLLDRAIDQAPSEIADAVETAAVAIQDDPDAAFEDPAVGEAVGEVDAFAAENCADEQIDVTLEDYAFTGMPDEIEKGTVAFNLANEGTELHEMIVFRIKGDATVEELLELSDEEASKKVTEIGGGFAPPGESSVTILPLKKTGRYVALCFLPVGSTDEASAEAAGEAGAPPHFIEGMLAEFEVTG